MSTKKNRIYRIVAAYLLLNMVAEFCIPVAAFALTNGPGQPEFQSFEPAGTTEMVNLFTGDFSYNIPLMTVPGPNGGYPINMAYHAGVSMEQEASWVGLGWNINAGAINRSMRGLPDDFNGDQVIKKLHFRPSNNLTLNFGQSFPNSNNKSEFLGFNTKIGGGVQVYYNNYRGCGFQYAGNFAISSAAHNSDPYATSLRINLTRGSDGIGVNVDYSVYRAFGSAEMGHTPGVGGTLSWGSREGIKELSLTGLESVAIQRRGSMVGAGVDFVASGYIPQTQPETEGFIANIGIELGIDTNFRWSAKKPTTLDASYSRSWVKETTQEYLAYGYNNLQNSDDNSTKPTMDDVNRDKDVPPGRQSKNLGVPMATYDTYSASAQGFGGTFRPYRSDIGILTETNMESNIFGGSLDVEWGVTAPGTTRVKTGADLTFSHTSTSSGMWRNTYWAGGNSGWGAIEDYQYLQQHASGSYNGDFTYEPFYFKMAGELTSAPTSQLTFAGGKEAVRLKLDEVFDANGNISPRPEIVSDILYNGTLQADLTSANNHRWVREKTVTRNVSRTNDQASRFAASVPENIYFDRNSFPAIGGTATANKFDYSGRKTYHIGEFNETGADGSRYLYGIPVYEESTREVMFSQTGHGAYPTDYSSTFNGGEASLANDELGTDQLYSSTELPAYATNYLLTAVFSPDYVDVTDNGPSEDDLGYYTKFNYVQDTAGYQWRAPYTGGILNAGFLSNEYDDKLSYMYGQKEMYYLHSIETKTHVACFFLKETARKDGHGAVAELSSSATSGQVAAADKVWALDHISLYSKADPNYGTASATPLKSVHFTTDYSLCPDVINNESTSGQTGKLTLLGLYFTYRNNEKGKLSPYSFEYVDPADATDLQNPDYNPLGNDRWGTYKKQEAGKYRNNENPYTDQSDRQRADQSAAAWCLKKITMPSGSVVDIKYEADDYAYVQDKKAMQMCRVIGFAKATENGLGDVSEKMTKKRVRVYFELNEPIPFGASAPTKEAIVSRYVADVDEMYFKLFLSLKKPYGATLGDELYDYVEGYCKVDHGSNTSGVVVDGLSDHLYAFATVELVDRDDYPNISNPTQVNPFEKAAWQYMYLERPDLFANPDIESGSVTNLAVAAGGILTEIPRMVAPYVTANVKGWGNKIDIDHGTHECTIRPSYIRLNTPEGKKVGGGHRVKTVQIHDGWNDLSGNVGERGEYGQSYSYEVVGGQSSGVAAYEPLLGGEENALSLPIRYNSDNLVKKDAAFYVTEPLGESYYPAPVVGYSRVVVSSIVAAPDTGQTVTKSRTGQTEYEFYTAKDYPVISKRTDLQKTWFPIPVIIPCVGSISYNVRGFSQGYAIELNDMHGKLKSVATYPASANLTSVNTIPTRRVTYKYNGGYTENVSNELSSTVDVLSADGVYGQANLGETYDFFFDLRQHSNISEELNGLQLNVTVNTVSPWDFIPVVLPRINISKSLYRSAVAMKVIYRTGILMEVETMDDGAKSYARNLMFDAETGAPLLTEVQNEFEKPVYTYNYAAHWAYEGMQGAYKNQGIQLNGITTTSGGVINVTNAENYFYPGDEVMYTPLTGTGTMLWVTQVSSGSATLKDASGANPVSLTGNFTIYRSGRRNLQSVSNGVIVSLTNPVTSRQFPLFDAFNAYTTAVEGMTASVSEFYTDCATGAVRNVTMTWSSNTLIFVASGGGSACEAFVTFPEGHGIDDLAEALTWDLHYNAGVVTATKGGTTLQCTWSDNGGCFKSCMDDVLHASAVRFSENWSADVVGLEQRVNFEDAGLTVTSTNEYKFGLRGVWRTHSNYLYQVDRKQTTASISGTDISRDGTYDNFVLYNWNIAARDNTNWSFVSAVTRYSPYGYALETRDALGIYSSSLYGYDNTKQTAAVSNCQYFEMGYDGFEEYGTTYTGGGHLLFTSLNVGTPIGLTSGFAHTGTKSMAVQYGGDGQYSVVCSGGTSPYATNQKYFEAIPGQEYFLSVWARGENGGTPAVIVYNGVITTTFNPDESVSAIEGWRKIDIRFVAPAASGTITINLSCEDGGSAYFDDLRIQPFKSAMASYVYDPQTHWLLAELDNRNFATFYNYDEEGALVQVKQETEKGIFTVQTSRGNIKR